MAKNDFRVTSVFKIIIRKTSKFLTKRYLFIFCIFYLNEKGLNHQVCLIKFAENEFSNPTSHKKKQQQKKTNHHPISKAFLKLLKNCTSYTSY